MSFQALHLDAHGVMREIDQEGELVAAIAADGAVTWVDVDGTDDADAAFLQRVFGFHPLAIAHALESRYERPKAEAYADHLFLMLHGVDHAETAELVATTELDLFIGRNYVVSAHIRPIRAVEDSWTSERAQPHLLARGPALLAYGLLDGMLEAVLPTLDRMNDVADTIEEEAVENPVPELLQAALNLKRSALRIQRAMAPQRDVLNRVGRGEYETITRDEALYFRDLADHVGRIEDLTMSIRERADNALATYLSAVGIRQNETMRVLSIVASVFLPLSLLAGIYGMNFEHMPELGWRYGYFAVLGVMLTVSGTVAWLFWARRWFGAGRQRVTAALNLGVEQRVLREALTEAQRVRRLLLGATRIGRDEG